MRLVIMRQKDTSGSQESSVAGKCPPLHRPHVLRVALLSRALICSKYMMLLFPRNLCFLLSRSGNCLVHSVVYTLLSYLQWPVSLHVYVISHFSHVQLFATTWTVAH